MIRRAKPGLGPTATADTASGGATTAPSVNAAATVSCGTVLYATYPTAKVVASGKPTASNAIGRMFLRRAIYELDQPAVHSNGGRITNITRSELSCTSG